MFPTFLPALIATAKRRQAQPVPCSGPGCPLCAMGESHDTTKTLVVDSPTDMATRLAELRGVDPEHAQKFVDEVKRELRLDAALREARTRASIMEHLHRLPSSGGAGCSPQEHERIRKAQEKRARKAAKRTSK